MFWTTFSERLLRAYYCVKLYPFRRERLAAEARRGFVGIQIDGLSLPHLRLALERGYLPHIARHLRRGNVLRGYRAGLPSTTPAAQAAIFYGDGRGIPAFRWFDRGAGRLLTCNDPDHVQHFRQRLFGGRRGLLAGGSSYANILDGGAERSVFTVSSPRPQTLFGRFGGLRILLLLLLHPLRACRLAAATVTEYCVERYDRWHFRRTRRWRPQPGLFPLIRIFCNVILRELQTFGVIADIYAGVPAIYTTYSGYDELAHHYGPASGPALKNLRHTDRRIGEIMRILEHAPGARYELLLLSDHGQTPGYPFAERFGATLGETVSAFLRRRRPTTVAAGPLDLAGAQLGFLREELDARSHGWRKRLYRASKNYLQHKIRQLVPETVKVDADGGVVITYSSSLAHLYLAGAGERLGWRAVETAHPGLIDFLRGHEGIGFVLARDEDGTTRFYHREGTVEAGDGTACDWDFLQKYGEPAQLAAELCRFAEDEACGDLILFGAYDGERIACFDDQVGGHGSVGGEQAEPFLILPAGHPLLERESLSGYAFLHHELFRPCLEGAAGP